MTYTEIEKLYNSYQRMEYKDNPELAEKIYNTIKETRSLASTKNGVDKWIEDICSILGAKSIFEKYSVISFITIALNLLRLEFDEEYAEMQFI